MIFKPTFRDNLGRFSTNRVLLIRILKVIGFIILVELALIGVENMLIDFNRLTSKYGVQKPIVIMTDDPDGETVFRIVKRPVIYSKPPLVIFSPVVKAVYEPVDMNKLNSIEQKILDTFGVENFRTMRAIAICESGERVDAVNWESKDVGLMQINWPTWKDEILEEFGYTLKDMFDVDKNLEVAKWIWDRDGDGNGSIEPWTATQTSCFRGNL